MQRKAYRARGSLILFFAEVNPSGHSFSRHRAWRGGLGGGEAQIMKNHILATGIFLFGFGGLQAHSASDISGRYLVPKGPSIVEIVHDGNGYKVTQISTPVAKQQVNNGRVRALIPDASATPLGGTVNDFDSGKQYEATWEVSDGGQSLTMKVKVAFFHASYVWKKQSSSLPPNDR